MLILCLFGVAMQTIFPVAVMSSSLYFIDFRGIYLWLGVDLFWEMLQGNQSGRFDRVAVHESANINLLCFMRIDL